MYLSRRTPWALPTDLLHVPCCSCSQTPEAPRSECLMHASSVVFQILKPPVEETDYLEGVSR